MQPRFAGFWKRLVAHIIDGMNLSLVSWLLELGILGLAYQVWSFLEKRRGGSVPAFSDAFDGFQLQLFNIGLHFCLALPYYVWGHFRYGTTLGKKALAIRVIQYNSLKPISLKQSFIRFFSYFISYLPFCSGFFMAGFHPEKRALHDLIAGTITVQEEKL